MLRVYFSAADLARTRIADGPDPLWETVLSLHQLREGSVDPALGGRVRCVERTGTEALRVLLPLVPVRGYFPDFLTPPEGAAGFETGLDAMMSTRKGELHAQIGRLTGGRPVTPWLRSLGDGEPAALRRLGEALRLYQRSALAPSWQCVRARTEGDRALRARTQWRGGTEAMLRTFGPGIRWRPPVLEADYPVESELRLEGRGLLLIPSYFCRRTPVALADPALPPTLVYPARSPAPEPAGDQALDLARLLGHTRAAVLQSLGGDCSTSELARRAGVSLSSASEHAAVLRGAGLIFSTRRHNSVHHALTPVGLALLHGEGRPRVPALRAGG